MTQRQSVRDAHALPATSAAERRQLVIQRRSQDRERLTLEHRDPNGILAEINQHVSYMHIFQDVAKGTLRSLPPNASGLTDIIQSLQNKTNGKRLAHQMVREYKVKADQLVAAALAHGLLPPSIQAYIDEVWPDNYDLVITINGRAGSEGIKRYLQQYANSLSDSNIDMMLATISGLGYLRDIVPYANRLGEATLDEIFDTGKEADLVALGIPLSEEQVLTIYNQLLENIEDVVQRGILPFIEERLPFRQELVLELCQVMASEGSLAPDQSGYDLKKQWFGQKHVVI